MSRRTKNRNSGADKKIEKILARAKPRSLRMSPKELKKMLERQAESWARQDRD